MAAAHGTVFQLVGIPQEYNHVVGAALVATALTGLGLVIKSKLKNIDDHIIPEPGVNIVNISTMVVGSWRSILHNMIGHGSDRYIPLIGTYFLFLLLSNYMGLVPGFPPPTENINTNFGIALCSFLSYQYFGVREHGAHYLQQFTGGLPPKGFSFLITAFMVFVAGLIVLIELVGHLIRPLSLSLRLWGNINGDHILVGSVLDLVPLLIPILAMGLGVLVCFIQSLVFSLLSAVYIKLAVSHDH